MNSQIKNIIILPLSLILLVGFIFVGHNDILCIDENGSMKFETECKPCCSESEIACNLIESTDIHKNHDDCSNCSDLTMNSAFLWSKRISKTTIVKPELTVSSISIHHKLALTTTLDVNSETKNFLLTFYKAPQSVSISTTVIRC